jgi:hypothetical protein
MIRIRRQLRMGFRCPNRQYDNDTARMKFQMDGGDQTVTKNCHPTEGNCGSPFSFMQCVLAPHPQGRALLNRSTAVMTSVTMGSYT